MFRNVPCSRVFPFSSGGGGGVGVHFPWRYHAFGTKKPKFLFLRIFKNKNLTKICLLSYKFYQRMITPNSNIFQRQYNIDADPIYATQLVLRPRKLIKNGARRNYERIAKTVDRSIQNGASSICFFVKWLLLLRVTFQACKSSIFPPQHHTHESSTLWAFSLVVDCRTHRKTRPVPRKIPKNITKAVGSSCFVATSKVRLPLTSTKLIYRKFD